MILIPILIPILILILILPLVDGPPSSPRRFRDDQFPPQMPVAVDVPPPRPPQRPPPRPPTHPRWNTHVHGAGIVYTRHAGRQGCGGRGTSPGNFPIASHHRVGTGRRAASTHTQPAPSCQSYSSSSFYSYHIVTYIRRLYELVHHIRSSSFFLFPCSSRSRPEYLVRTSHSICCQRRCVVNVRVTRLSGRIRRRWQQGIPCVLVFSTCGWDRHHRHRWDRHGLFIE